MRTKMLPITLGALLLVSMLAAGWIYSLLINAEQNAISRETDLAHELEAKSVEHAEAQARIVELEQALRETQILLEETITEKDALGEDLSAEKERNEEFEDQIKEIGSTVGTLDKLAKTDPELLMKYSKVYFLNEHYMPAQLTELPKDLLYSEAEPKFIHTEVLPFLTDMIEDAAEDGVKLWIKSAFRSFDEQEDLKGAYTVAYGSGANTFSADQGYSEHQLGTTIDITTEGLGGALTNFDTTTAYTWLLENAHRYGFVLSYPDNNAYYIFEPWHWRFVGEELARDLHEDGKYFYDLDQREIDAYLISLFD